MSKNELLKNIKLSIDKFNQMEYYILADRNSGCNMEKSRSWPSAHDWKSCIPQKGIEGSNPSFSAITKDIRKDVLCFFV